MLNLPVPAVRRMPLESILEYQGARSRREFENWARSIDPEV